MSRKNSADIFEAKQAIENFIGSNGSLLDGALIVARIIRNEVDTQWCRNRLAELAAGLPHKLDAAALCSYLTQSGFHGSPEYYKSDNSNLEHVLRTGEGIPISLAIVIICLCEMRSVPASGINFPGHFLVAVNDVYLDPFELCPVSDSNISAWIKSQNIDPKTAFATATPQSVVLRMLNNLSGLAHNAAQHERALELSELRLLLAPNEISLYLERSELWVTLGVPEMARRELAGAIELAPTGQLKDKISARLAEIAAKPQQLH